MDVQKCEKSLDNRCVAMVSREPRAPRAGKYRKPCMVNGLRMMDVLTRARGAQVSRALPKPTLAARFTGTFLPFPASQERRPSEMRMSLDVTECHMCDIAWFIHKVRLWNCLDLELQPNSIHFREK